MRDDRNCLSFWLPRLQAAGLPVPKTEIVHWPPADKWGLAALLDGKEPGGFDVFVKALTDAAEKVGPYPVFFRTGQGSGKHDWDRCCHLKRAEDIPAHVAALVEWSHLVDFMGLPHDVWAVREMLPTKPLMVLEKYGGFPLVREVRAFVRDGKPACCHPYWPAGAVRAGTRQDVTDEMIAAVHGTDQSHFYEIISLLDRVAKTFKDDGAWSVDLLETDRGWYVTDMAEAHRSFHWPECEFARKEVAGAAKEG